MTEDQRALIAYFQQHRHILPSVINFFSWQSRHCTPVEAVLFWKSLTRDERLEYAWQIDLAMYEIRMEFTV